MVDGDERPDHDVDAHSEVAHGVAEEAGGEPTVAAYLAPALREIPPEALRGWPRVRHDAHRSDEDHADEEAAGVDREHPAGARDRDDRTREGRAEDEGRAAGERDQRIRLLQAAGADGLRDERLRGRVEEAGGRSGDPLQHRELPDVRGPAEEQHRSEGLRADPDEVGRDHHRAPRQAVRPDAPRERDGGSSERVAREHEADARRAASKVVADGPDERDGDERVADRRAGTREPEQPELAFSQRSEAADPLHVIEMYAS